MDSIISIISKMLWYQLKILILVVYTSSIFLNHSPDVFSNKPISFCKYNIIYYRFFFTLKSTDRFIKILSTMVRLYIGYWEIPSGWRLGSMSSFFLKKTSTVLITGSGVATGGNGGVRTPPLLFRPLLGLAQIRWKVFFTYRGGGFPCMYIVTFTAHQQRNMVRTPPLFWGWRRHWLLGILCFKKHSYLSLKSWQY